MYPVDAEGGDGGSDITKYAVAVSNASSVILQHEFLEVSQSGDTQVFENSELSWVGSSKSDGVYKLRMSNLFGGQYFDISVTSRNVRSLSASTKSVRLKTLDPCEPGSFLDSSEQCEPCDIGRYSANSNVDRQCKLCDAGKFQTETGASSCRKCAKGIKSDSDGLGMGCEPCKTGRYTDTLGMPVCAVCNAGKYADILGSHECKVCPENTYRLKPEAKDQRSV